MDIQKELIQFLLMRLKACNLESAAFRATVFNFSEEDQARTMATVEHYRQSAAIRQKVEMGFLRLDLLIQQVQEAPDQESARKLFEQFDPTGRLVN